MSKEIISGNKIDDAAYINNTRLLSSWVLMIEFRNIGRGADKTSFQRCFLLGT